MHYLYLIGFLALLFLALPWLVIAFNRYCDAINRYMIKRKQRATTKGN